VGETIDLTQIPKGAVVFPVAPGSDNSGWLQQNIEAAGLAFVGGGSRACRLAHGARGLRQALSLAGVAVAPFLSYSRADDRPAMAARVLRSFPAGCLIRPDAGDAMISSHFGFSAAEVLVALEAVLTTSGTAFIECIPDGRTFSLACLGQGGHTLAAVLPVVEVVEHMSTDFTFYRPGDTKYVRPGDLDSATQADFERIATTVLSVVPTPLLRVSVLLDRSGAVVVQAADVSPLLLPSGLVAIAAANAGWSFSDLVWQAIDSACYRASMGSA
jgi:D-alanine-D-alanine ligase